MVFAIVCRWAPPISNMKFVSERVLHLCGSHLHPEETGRLLHDGCLCPNPADSGSLLAFLLDQPGCKCCQSAPG